MTVVADDLVPGALDEPAAVGDGSSPDGSPPPAPDRPLAGETEPEQLVSTLLTGVATLLAVASAGWMIAGIFAGFLPRLVALAGALVGVGLITLSYRMKRPSLLQYLSVPAVLGLGYLLIVPYTRNGQTVTSLVQEALRSGGIANPPVSFDPGWRLILVVLVGVLGAAAAALATGFNRPRLGILLPAPLVLGAALLQPPGTTVTSSVPSLALFIASFAAAFGVDLRKDGAASGGFELRRLLRTAVGLVSLVVALLALAQFGFLFQKPPNDRVIPPQRPQVPPPQPDRVLFTVTTPQPMPLRLGVLDVYSQVAWFTPPYDVGRLEKLPASGLITPGTKAGELPGLLPTKQQAGQPIQVTFTTRDITDHLLPDVANPIDVSHPGFTVSYDPRTQALNLPGTTAQSVSYTVTAEAPPGALQLSSAGPPEPAMAEYLQVPAPPPLVQKILNAAPKGPAFDRLQYVRNVYYTHIVAAGVGKPVDVPPSRVDAMLGGSPASPYEITAGEVLMARWAGIPARFGYGYYGGTKIGANTYSIRPDNGATWLEAYFSGYGWVPIVGTPPRAQESIRPNHKNQDRSIRPTDRLALVVYLPIRLQTIQLLYVIVRFWLARLVPAGLGIGLALFMIPGLAKLARRSRRRRWAHNAGPADRIAVAYAEFRDQMNDLNYGLPAQTPLEFLRVLSADPEHEELAWLVSRALWGDLRRDLRDPDAELAEQMAASMRRRVSRASPAINRIVAFGSRASLRDPYSSEIPNLWPRRTVRLRTRVRLPRPRRRPKLVPA